MQPSAVPGGCVSVTLRHSDGERVGLQLHPDTLELVSCTVGSSAAASGEIRACVGMLLVEVEGEAVRTREQVLDLTDGRSPVRLSFLTMASYVHMHAPAQAATVHATSLCYDPGADGVGRDNRRRRRGAPNLRTEELHRGVEGVERVAGLAGG
eukprot:gene18614-42674_t